MGEVWAEPVFVVLEEGLGAYVGPGLFGVPDAEAEDAVLPLLYLGREVEELLTFGFDGFGDDVFELLGVGICQGFGLEDDAADAEIGGGEELLFAAVPPEVLGFCCKVCEVLWVERGGEEDFALSFLCVELGDGEPGFVCKVVFFIEAGGLSVCELEEAVCGVFCGGDTFGIGIGEQEAGGEMVGGGVVGRYAEEFAVGGGGFLDFFPFAVAPPFSVRGAVALGAVAAELFNAVVEVGAGGLAVEWVAFFEQGGDVCREGERAGLLGGDEHVGKARVAWQAVDLFAVVGDFAVADGAEGLEEFFGAADGVGGWIVEPAEGAWVGDAPFEEIEEQRGEVAVEDFGGSVWREALLGGGGPHAIAGPGAEAACAAGALVGRVDGDLHGFESREAVAGVEGLFAGVAAVDYDFDSFDGEGGFGDGGGEDDFSSAVRVGHEGGLLLGVAELSVEAVDGEAAEGSAEDLGGFADFGLAGEKGEQVSLLLFYCFGDGAGSEFGELLEVLLVGVYDVDGVHFAFAFDDGCF